jgi:hypothetical protein
MPASTEANPGHGWVVGIAQTARQCAPGLQDDGCSRDSFFRFKELYLEGGGVFLRAISGAKPILANRVGTALAAPVELTIEQFSWRQLG